MSRQMSKFGLHYQKIPKWAPGLVKTIPLEWVKIVNPPRQNPFPGKQILGRIYHDEGEDNKLIMQGAKGAEEYFKQCLSTYDSLRYVAVWEGPNEPPVRKPEQRAKLVEFTLRWAKLIHAMGWQVAALSLSVGWPDIGTSHEFAEVVRVADYITLHEYGAPSMKDDVYWHCLRYQGFVEELAAVGVDAPKIFIGETGVDGGCIEQGGKGWKSFTSRLGYFDMLLWYNQRLCENDCVVAFFPFTSGPYKDWRDFDFDRQLVEMVGEYLETIVPPPPSVDIPGQIREEAWNRVGIDYNPNAALARAARKREMGAPVTGEFNYDKYRAQGFVGGVLFCEIGHWDNIMLVVW